MAEAANCWEMKGCGRQAGGPRAHELGICPAARETCADGLNRGAGAGRSCWTVAGTFCGGRVQGSFAQKRLTCMSCDVYARVRTEEGPDFRLKT